MRHMSILVPRPARPTYAGWACAQGTSSSGKSPVTSLSKLPWKKKILKRMCCDWTPFVSFYPIKS